MSRRLLIAIAVALLGLAAPALARADGTISGTVTDAAATPISELCVFAEGLVPGPELNAQTASDGSYAIDVPAGSYVIEFSACSSNDNLATQWYPDRTSDSAAQPLSVADGQTLRGIDATMQAGGRIVVQAVDADSGAALSGTTIALWTPGAEEADPTVPAGVDSLGIAESVSTTFAGLPAGSYLIEAAGDPDGNEARTWYPDAPDPAHAQLIQIEAGETDELTLPFFHGGTIDGTVTGAGAAIPKAEVAASVKEPDGSIYRAGGAKVLPDGQYTASDIAPGAWTITASSGRRWVPQAQTAQITEGADRSIDFRLPRGPAVDDRRPVRLHRLQITRDGRALTIIGRISERQPITGVVTLSFGHLYPGRHTLRLARFTAVRGRFRIVVQLPRAHRLVNPRLFVDINESHVFAPRRLERRLPPRRTHHR